MARVITIQDWLKAHGVKDYDMFRSGYKEFTIHFLDKTAAEDALAFRLGFEL
jgi:hypothetical protein